jgi:glycolate oxidase FAD binding subunit
MVTAARVADAFAAAVGADHVRDAAAQDAVAGVMPALVVSPGTEEEVGAVLQAAARHGLAVVVRGGGSKLAWGAPPRRFEVVLSTARLSGVVEHEPGDLVCVVRAGTPLASLRTALAAHRQRLALDPAHGVSATIGGIVAAGAHGPLRTRFGTARDLVLGARFVTGDGVVGHSGGKVVKNVAGYDVAKLLIGSLGTLAVVTEVALRLHPEPHARCTVAVQDLGPEQVDAVWRALLRSGVEPAAVVALSPGGAMLVRVEGTEHGAAAQAATLLEAARAVAPRARELDAGEADRAWGYAETCVWAGDPVDPVANVAVPRTELAALLQRLAGVTHVAVALPSHGVADVRLPAATAPADVASLRSWVQHRGGNVVLRRATPALAGVVWPQVGEDDVALDLMRSLKRSLDPQGTLAPGRFLGGI